MDLSEPDLIIAKAETDFDGKNVPPLDLNDFLVKRPESTFFMRAGSDALRDFGVFKGDILCVDRALDAVNGAIVVVYAKNGFLARKFVSEKGAVSLAAGNPDFKTIPVRDASKFRVFGVVISVIRKILAV